MAAVQAQRIIVRGTVQGVGFRPFVYRLARELGIAGWVRNDGGGVLIHAEAGPDALAALADAIRARRPPAAVIAGLEIASAAVEGLGGFTILDSAASGPPTTRISPDLAVCDDCLRELRDPADRRHRYPYINCTNCGPRFSIIRALPYDRPRTTMADWPLCPACRAEYENPADRRYHAQPVACPACGPTYQLVLAPAPASAGSSGAEVGAAEVGPAATSPAAAILTGPEAITRAAGLLRAGAILAVKGIGGYHLACDAASPAAVAALRERKFRKEKPFAVMAASLASARRLARLDPPHLTLLTSVARPIVLAPALAHLPGVAPDTDEIGLMLPYAPLHHLLFAAGAPDPLVLTSANRSSEPIAYTDDDARARLAGIADAFLIGQRPIHRRVDDSVVGVRRGAAFVLRRGRGYAPASVARVAARSPILALGADLKNTIALTTGGDGESDVFLSQHIGDLGDLETDRALADAIADLLDIYAIDRTRLIVAHDLHPEYVSTRTALALPAARFVPVQHHEAHIAAVQLEFGILDQTVVGIALDGTGFGRDGAIWGGELLLGSARHGYARVGSLAPVLMPGGDAAARHPVQAAAAFLPDLDPAILERPPFAFPPRFRQAQSMIAARLRTIASTSAGRLFDAAAAVCGFTREVTFEGQAAIWLETLAGTISPPGTPGSLANATNSSPDPNSAPHDTPGPPPSPSGPTSPHLPGDLELILPGSGNIDSARLIRTLVQARLAGVTPAELAAWFHEVLAAALLRLASAAAAQSNASAIVLAGGVWQNRRLLDAAERHAPRHCRLLLGSQIPCNDAGISAGQIAIASFLTA